MAAPVPTFTLHSWETRRYSVTVTADTDPTGDTIEFGVAVESTADQDPASWTAGTWPGSYTSGEAEAYSPTFGTSESTITPGVTLTEDTTYHVYARVRSATDAPGDRVARIVVK